MMIEFDKNYAKDGYVCGIDEAGRGPLFGPVVVASCVMSLKDEDIIAGVNDSKKLTEKKRERLYEEIIQKAIAYHIAFVDAKRIDEINILQATIEGMKECATALGVKVNAVLVDGNPVDLGIESINVVHGDAKSYHIAAASILAKVARDRYIREIAEQYPNYDLKSHKGYGTSKHREELKQFGPSDLHRMSFIKNIDRW